MILPRSNKDAKTIRNQIVAYLNTNELFQAIRNACSNLQFLYTLTPPHHNNTYEQP